MREWIEKLININIGLVLENEPLSKHTTWKIGGPADALIYPKDQESLIKVIKLINSYQIKWKIIGRGSNILVLDAGFHGAIISLDNTYFQNITIEDKLITAGAGASLIRLANLAAKYGLTGLEFAGGIPGSVGGAVYMNAGAHGSDISKILVEANLITENGEIVQWKNNDFSFSYRTSSLQKNKAIIISSKFELEYGDRKMIAEDMANFKSRRRNTQPYNLPCTGSVFRNPEGDYAGRLIENLGLKGYQIGGAQVSNMHANFIVNAGDATAKDVLKLIDFLVKRVFEAYGITLVPEVEIVGES